MDVNQLVNEAVKAEIKKSLEAELKRKNLSVDAVVRKYVSSKKFQDYFKSELERCAREWVENQDFFEDIPDVLYKKIMDRAYKAIFK